MKVVAGKHPGQGQEDLSYFGRCTSTSQVRGGDSDDARSHHLPGAQLWVGSSRNWSVFRGRP